MGDIEENDIKVRYLVENKIDLRIERPIDVQIPEEEGNAKADELKCAFMKVSAKKKYKY